MYIIFYLFKLFKYLLNLLSYMVSAVQGPAIQAASKKFDKPFIRSSNNVLSGSQFLGIIHSSKYYNCNKGMLILSFFFYLFHFVTIMILLYFMSNVMFKIYIILNIYLRWNYIVQQKKMP